MWSQDAHSQTQTIMSILEVTCLFHFVPTPPSILHPVCFLLLSIFLIGSLCSGCEHLLQRVQRDPPYWQRRDKSCTFFWFHLFLCQQTYISHILVFKHTQFTPKHTQGMYLATQLQRNASMPERNYILNDAKLHHIVINFICQDHCHDCFPTMDQLDGKTWMCLCTSTPCCPDFQVADMHMCSTRTVWSGTVALRCSVCMVKWKCDDRLNLL